METKGMESKNRIITQAGFLFIKNGYHTTGLQEILKECGLPKGSFYYYFKGKEDLAIQVCLYYKQKILGIFVEAAKQATWSESVEVLVESLKEQMRKGYLYGCPIAVIGMETAQSEPKIAAECQKGLEELTQGFEKSLLKYGFSKEDAGNKAELLMEVYEGTLLYYRISQDLSVFDRMKVQFCSI